MVEQWSYGYDEAGNRTSYSVYSTGESATYTYPSANELTKTVDGGNTTSYSYDGNGNLTVGPPGRRWRTTSRTRRNPMAATPTPTVVRRRTDQVQENSTTFNYSGLGISSQSDEQWHDVLHSL